MTKITCKYCSKEFKKRLTTSSNKYCSLPCYWKDMKDSDRIRGKNHPRWKDKNYAYTTIHNWLRNNYGTPMTCEFCKQYHESGHMMHWANKSGGYKRDLNDWLRLCAKCHWHYDREEAE